ncbi:MAG: DoxX family membrane protein [Symbiobacteriia bacterium]
MSRIFKDSRLSVLWLVLRLYLGWGWLTAGFEKLTDAKGAWVGAAAGSSLKGFFAGAIAKSTGAHPAVQGWYAGFLKNIATPAIPFFTYLVPVGEFLVGLALITGTLTLVAAFFGLFMNLNFMLAGSTSTNPIYYTVAVLLLFAGVNAGRYGVDGFLASRKGKTSGATSAA